MLDRLRRPRISLVNARPALLDVFRAARGEAERGGVDAAAGNAALSAFVDAARAAWPDFGIGDEELVRYAAARIPAGKLPLPAHAGDLMLACACSRGAPGAFDAFCAAYGSVVARVLCVVARPETRPTMQRKPHSLGCSWRLPAVCRRSPNTKGPGP